MRLAYDSRYKLNAVCPYFTMFPVEFPLQVLSKANKKAMVADPFCGRGTTNFAARVLKLDSFGIDSSKVAVAIARAKLATTSVERVMRLARCFIDTIDKYELPRGQFWRKAFHSSTLHEICKIRTGLLAARHSQDAVMLRGIMLGCLHGPLAKKVGNSGYFSNQMPRTYGSKPDYSVKYWRKKNFSAPKLSVLGPIRRKAEIVLARQHNSTARVTAIIHGDSRRTSSYKRLTKQITHVITSPPYYGLRTYVEDQWLRNWFLGGPPSVPYGHGVQVSHCGEQSFMESLTDVWNRVGERASPNIRMVVRFGTIGSYRLDPRELLEGSLSAGDHDWKIYRTLPVGTARKGKRQANLMVADSRAFQEYDIFIKLQQ